MSTQKMNNELMQGVNLAKMTKEEAQHKTDEELLLLVEKSKKHTGKDFSTYMNCDFSYSFLTSLLRDRGYENGWYKKTSNIHSKSKEPIVIEMKKPEDKTIRKSFILDEYTAELWKLFNQNFPYPSVNISYALRRYMKDVNEGRIKFEFHFECNSLPKKE